MKTFATLLLVFALAAYVSAFERPFHTAVFDFLDERHDERMAQVVRDQGLPKNTLVAREHKEPPEWIKPCIAKGKQCWTQAEHNVCSKLCCIDRFIFCTLESHPGPLPELSPVQKACVVLLHLCRKHSPTCAGEMCCFVRIKRCFDADKGKPDEPEEGYRR
ncbi:uncharacterized protein LOC110044144 [Orbicella faveolata]|uniref:uncharacterized protein LOC110044144 n=1 Tax=Orbicella faveolata TaxID=48498 RepID=UPI0009E30D95|nr:uncharacterized protein LOC110044144 [Orbicella faveolata]